MYGSTCIFWANLTPSSLQRTPTNSWGWVLCVGGAVIAIVFMPWGWESKDDWEDKLDANGHVMGQIPPVPTNFIYGLPSPGR